jgi:hypothetical protein
MPNMKTGFSLITIQGKARMTYHIKDIEEANTNPSEIERMHGYKLLIFILIVTIGDSKQM